MSIFSEMLWLLFIDAIFVFFLLGALGIVGLLKPAAFAVMKRNFVGYFSSPTGYAFICLFVLLTSTATFWPVDFFNSNLANFDQLNRYIPLIMLVFIPAITMSIWADERRQGTDELLLTLPATDFEIVIGKYLAAASIFTAALLFSQFCNYFVLALLSLGDLDTGLLFATYFGYWLMGLAMLALGMVASFLTNNLTVSFILGALINVPLVGAMYVDLVVPRQSLSRLISEWSLARQVEDFGRGTFGFAPFSYFVLIAVLGVYLSMVLIGRRHWSGGRDGQSLLGHYLLRIFSLVVLIFAANSLFRNVGGRLDATEGKVNSLSRDTRRIIQNLNAKHTVNIEAYIGAHIPEDYVKTRAAMISMLREFESMSGGKIRVNIHDNLEPFSKDASQAEKRFGIRPRPVRTRSQGVFKDEQVILGAGFTCGLEKVVVPFFDYGIPVEYELLRSINTVAKGERKKLGVIHTDAQLMGGFEFNGMQPANLPKQQIIEELEKQYEVELVEPNVAIDPGKYDVLMVVQPSSLGPPELANVVDVIKKGQPTAIFEDPLPTMMQAPGTGQPKRQNPMASMFGGGGPPPPKGNITDLWKAIGVKAEGEDRGPGMFNSRIVWQRFNPYKKVQVGGFGDEFVFIRNDAPLADKPFNESDIITSGIEEVLFPYPGAISPDPDNKDVKFTPLVETSRRAGTLSFEDLQASREDPIMLQFRRGPEVGKYTIAARIEGKAAASEKNEKSDSSKDDTKKDEPKPIHVVYVSDIDLMTSEFVRIREQPDQEFRWRFENVTFVLNVIDSLAGETDYVGTRNRKTHYSSLKAIEQYADEARSSEMQERKNFDDEYNNAIRTAEKERDEAIKKLQDNLNDLNNKKRKGEQVDAGEVQAIGVQFGLKQEAANQRLESEKERLRRERDDKIQQIRREKDLQIENMKREFKIWAVIWPPIPPLIIALIVFVRRQLREREGISKARLV